MSQTTIQKQKITPEQIFPTWAKYLDYIVAVNNQIKDVCVRDELARIRKKQLGLGIGKCDKCVVGEAHGFSDEYDDPFSLQLGIKTSTCRPCGIFAGSKTSFTRSDNFVELYNDVIYGRITDWRNTSTVTSFLQHYEEVHLK